MAIFPKNALSLLPFLCFIMLLSCQGQVKSKSDTQITQVEPPTLSIGHYVKKMEKDLMIIFQDQKNNYWFGTKIHGVYQYDGKRLIQYTMSDGLVQNNIRSIQEDKLGNIYFDTGAGISKFDGQTFETLLVQKSDLTKDQWSLGANDLWFEGNWNEHGPYRYDGQTLQYLEFPKNPLEYKAFKLIPNASFNPYDIYKIFKDSKGHIWFGTAALGVGRYDGQHFSWITAEGVTELDGGPALGVRSIFEDQEGNFWFNNDILHQYQILSDDPFQYEVQKGVDPSTAYNFDKYFMATSEDNNGNLWLVTSNNGVWKYYGYALTHQSVHVEDTTVQLFSIYKDKNGTLWLGSHNGGAFKFNGFTFESFNPITHN